MSRLAVLKDVAYASKVGGGTVADISEIDELVQGAFAFFNEKGELLVDTAGVVNGLADCKVFTVGVGRLEDHQVFAGIPRQGINEVNKTLFRAFVKPAIAVGTAGSAGLGFVDGEEASIRVLDKSYTTRYAIQSANASVYKTAVMTEEQAVDLLVSRLNKNGDGFITAVKTGASPDFAINVTAVEDGTTFDIVTTGSLEGISKPVITAPVYGVGTGEQLLKMEKECSVDEGNGNYTEYTDLFYKRQFEALMSESYDLTTILWDGVHNNPTGSNKVMHNRVVFAFPNGGAVEVATNLTNILAALVGNAYASDEGEEPAADDGTNTDGVAGN